MSGQAERPEAENLDDSPANTEATDATETTEQEAGDELERLQAKADENWERYLRAAAEVENVRKRASRDVEKAHKFALESFAKELLGVCDSLEAGLAAADAADAKALLEGSQATHKQLIATLGRFGISEIDPQGEPFDPELHEAMVMQPSDEVEPGSVLTVVQKGYSLNERLLRPARVIVAAEPAGDD